MGATRRRTKSCSDSMHDPNCPLLEPVGDKDDAVVMATNTEFGSGKQAASDAGYPIARALKR